MGTFILDGAWKLQTTSQFSELYRPPDFDDSDWETQDIPAQWQNHPKFQKYHGRMVYRKHFLFEKEPNRLYEIHFAGIFYGATIHLNGKRLGRHEGYFLPFWFDISDILSEENILVVEVDCPYEKPGSAERLITGIFSQPIYFSPDFNPGGIWRSVTIEQRPGHIVRYLRFNTESCSPETAHVGLHITIDSLSTEELPVRIELQPDNFEGPGYQWNEFTKLRMGRNQLRLGRDLDQPRLWWPRDFGHPHLYRLDVYINEEKAASRIAGIRTAAMDGGKLLINGHSAFIRGAVYLPTRPYLSQVSPELCRDDVGRAIGLNVNMLRVRNHVATPEFYYECDRQGMLVWQDFPIKGMYPKEAANQIMTQLKRLFMTHGTHPGIVIWSCHDEPLPDVRHAETFGQRVKSFFGYYFINWNKNFLDNRMRKQLHQLDQNLIVIQSSGLWRLFPGPLSDVHFHWYNIDKWIKKFQRMNRFSLIKRQIVSDFGVFSSSAPLPVDMGNGGEEPPPADSQYLITQERQGQVLRFFIENLRTTKCKPTMGFFLAALCDLDPDGGPGIFDASRRPKLAYEIVKSSLLPHRLFATEILGKHYRLGDVGLIPILLSNDTNKKFTEVKILVKIKLERKPIMETTMVMPSETEIPPTQVDTVFFRPQQSGVYELVLWLMTDDNMAPIDVIYELQVM